MKDALQQKTVGCMIYGGAVVAVISFGLMYVFGMAGVFRGTYTRTPITNEITDAGPLNWAPLMLTFMVIGMLSVVGGLGYAWWIVRAEKTGPRQVVPQFRVLARYAYDKNGYYLADDAQIEFAERPRFYIRGVMPSGATTEFEASEEVWRQAGEGMYGEAELQGKWVGRFTPYIGTS